MGYLDEKTGKPVRCCYCGGTERNASNTGMACWEDPTSTCSRAGALMKQRYGEDFEERIWKVYEETCVRVFMEVARADLRGGVSPFKVETSGADEYAFDARELGLK